MSSIPSIALVPRRQEDLHSGHPDYHVFAGEQMVGRIYQNHFGGEAGWFWAVNAVSYDMSVGTIMSGFAPDFETSKARLRAAFDSWLRWALAMPAEDLKFAGVDANLRAMGVR